jgi:23S rRNA (guanosine2251-2'-O)-methyltransferase
VNLARTLRELRDKGVWLIGTADEAERTLYDVDMTAPRPSSWAPRARACAG